MKTSFLPGYSPFLEAYHAAFAHDLQAMIAELPFCAGDRVLDMGCGDGTYSVWIAARVVPGGSVVGVDLLPAYLRLARARLRNHRLASIVRFQQGDIHRLPFEAGTFDAAWCAQSFYSFPDPLETLRELARVTRRGGVIAVLENDSFHQILLPWPVEVELAVCEAEYAALRAKEPRPRKYYVGRNLRELFAKAGLKPQRKKMYAWQREVPLTSAEARFLKRYLADLRDRTRLYVRPEIREQVDSYLNPHGRNYLPDRPQLTLTCLDHIVWGKKP